MDGWLVGWTWKEVLLSCGVAEGEDISLNWRKTINLISTLMTNPLSIVRGLRIQDQLMFSSGAVAVVVVRLQFIYLPNLV